MLWNSLVPKTMDEVYESMKRSEEELRRKHINKLADYYNGNQKGYIKNYIDRSDDDIPYSYTNLTRKLIKKIANVYNESPTRVISPEGKSDKYADATKDKNAFMKECERQTKLLGNTAVLVHYDPNAKRFTYKLIKYFVPAFDETGENVIAVGYPIDTGKPDAMWYWANDEEYWVSDNTGRRMGGHVLNQPNELGFLPYAFLSKDNTFSDFWSPDSADIVDTNEMINLALTDLNYELRYQSFKQLYISGDNGDFGDQVEVGYNRVINIPAGATAGAVDLKTDLTSTIEAIKFQVQMLERNYGLSINWGIEGAPSGFSLMVQNIDVLENWEDDIIVAEKWEREIFEIEKAILAKYGIRVDSLDVNFAEVSFPIDEGELRQKWDWLIEKNIATPADFYVREYDKDISREDAEKMIAKNREFNKAPKPEQINERRSIMDELIGG